MTLGAMVTLETDPKVQYLCMLVREEALIHFDLVSADAKNTETLLDVDYVLKGLAWYFLHKFTFKTKACNAPLYEKSM